MHGVVTTYQQVAAQPDRRARAGAAARSSSSTRSTTAARSAPGATRCGRRSAAPRGACACRARPFAATRAPSRSSATRPTRPCPTSSTATATRCATAAWCGRSISRRVGGEMEWSAPDGALHAASFDDPLTHGAGQPAPAHGAVARGRVAAGGAARRRRSARARCAACQPNAGGLVIATDQEHARGIADLLSWRFHVARDGGDLGRPGGVGAHRRVRRGHERVAGGGAHGVRGRRYSAAAGRRVRHHDDDRPVFPPGGRPLRALGAGRARPARLVVRPRRSARCARGRR